MHDKAKTCDRAGVAVPHDGKYLTVLYFIVLYFTLHYLTLLYITVLYFTLLYVLYFTSLNITVLYFTLLYYLDAGFTGLLYNISTFSRPVDLSPSV